MAQGTCKLTGQYGPLVDAHILPKALTYPAEKGMPFAQGGEGHPPVKRWSSWYDPNIVTRAGEDLLAGYDDWAITELRRHRLVWSGWGDTETLIAEDYEAVPYLPEHPKWGVRRIGLADGERLRLFFLSLLWRAAVSEMPEFAEISVHASDLRRLRRMLVEGDPAPLHRFPVSLVQLSTKGAIHNHAPIAQRKPLDPTRPDGPSIPIFRFYFDGLIAHFHREADAKHVEKLGDMLLGGGKTLIVTTIPFEESWQRDNLARVMGHVAREWPDRLARIPGFRKGEI